MVDESWQACYSPGMDPTQQRRQEKLEIRQGYEREAAETGVKRARLEDDLAATTQWIVEFMPTALQAGIPLDTYAKFVGVSRQTLYRWQEAKRIHNEHHAD